MILQRVHVDAVAVTAGHDLVRLAVPWAVKLRTRGGTVLRRNLRRRLSVPVLLRRVGLPRGGRGDRAGGRTRDSRAAAAGAARGVLRRVVRRLHTGLSRRGLVAAALVL